MKNKISILLIILSFGFIACNSTGKNEKNKIAEARIQDAMIEDAQDAIGEPAKPVEKNELMPTKIISPEQFNEIWQSLSQKNTPLIDTTNFDNINEVKALNAEEISSLRLSEIYTDIEKEGHSYKFIPAYKLDLSDDFRSIVLNVFKGEHELETVLINYSLEAQITAHKIIAYDEIAEGWSRKYATVKDGMIAIVDVFYGNNTRIDTTEFHIGGLGEINPIKTKYSSDLRPDKVIRLNQIYTDTIEFSSYNDDYDYRVLQGKKNGQVVGVIYNWDWVDHEKYNFKIGELIKVKWKMERIIHAGDEFLLDFSEIAIEAERVLSENNYSPINGNGAESDKATQVINYFEFTPDTILNSTLDNFKIDYAYQLENNKIIAAYDKKANPDTDKDWGDKLLLLNNENEILFKSHGVGDVYLFEPHFYKSKLTDKTIIICQLGFEYFCGGEAFVYENGKITTIGILDIEGDNGEKSLTEIIEVNEKDNEIVFTFKSESLVLEPGSEDILIKNTGVKYIYKDKELILIK